MVKAFFFHKFKLIGRVSEIIIILITMMMQQETMFYETKNQNVLRNYTSLRHFTKHLMVKTQVT